jgi:restriction system protein
MDQYPDGLPADIVERIARPRKSETDESDRTSDEGGGSSAKEATFSRTPQERIDQAVEELNESLSEQLLELIHSQTDRFFENLVLDVLREMGYGAGRGAIRHQGGVHDGGIDGIISLDRLGLEKVYIQAKRWRENSVGRPEIQAFSGALRGRAASKGVFITTSTFTKHAVEFAERVSDSIVLVDGDRLTSLMIEYGVGVQTERTVRVADADRDYFEAD